MKFGQNIKTHLSTYKVSKYPKFKNGNWRNDSSKELKYAFTKNDQDFNIIEYYRDEFLKSDFNKKIKRHIYFNHLNSSQAMCINFFYPLIVENKLNLITEFLEFSNEIIVYNTVAFEKLSHIDSINGHRPTNFDFYFETESGEKFFFEIKYTENGFGKAPKDKSNKKIFDKEHTDKFISVYNNNLDSVNSEYHSVDKFLSNYQIMRNLIHVGNDSYVVFLYPSGNEKIKRQAIEAKERFIVSPLGGNFFTKEWENIYDYVINCSKGTKLNSQLTEFGNKYFI